MRKKIYRTPSYLDVFKAYLKTIGKDDLPLKQKGSKYFTAVSFKKVVQKVYFDTNDEIISFTSLSNGKEKVDCKVKALWVDEKRVQFKEIY